MVDRDPHTLAERYSPGILISLVVGFMFWVRMIPAERIITETAVFFSGNDAWYHERVTQYIVRYFPRMTPFDPWSYFPFGTGRHSGFGGLYDQLVALAALVVGLGSPSEHLVEVALAVAPATFGALTAIPTYFIATRLTDRRGGVAAAVLLSLSSGSILFRTIVGASDHQSAEALFGTLAVAGFVYSVGIAYREKPMVTDVRNRNWDLIRIPVVAGVLGGVLVASYLTVWPPGVMLLFTFGVFVVVQLSRDHLGGRPPDYLTYATVTAMTTAGGLTLLYARTYTLQSTAFSLLQPLVAFGVAAGALVLLGLSRYFDREGYDRGSYPYAVGGLIVASLALIWLVYPRGIDMLGELVVRVYSFGLLTTVSAGTVAEIQPASSSDAFFAFGGILLLAIGGFFLLAYRVGRENRPVELLVVLWSLSMFAVYFTMARFGYYFAITVAVLAGVAVSWTVTQLLAIDATVADLVPADRDATGGATPSDGGGLGGLDLYQILGLLVIVLLIVPGNVVSMAGRQPVWKQADQLGETDQAWFEGLNWLQANSPELPMGYYEWYERPADGDFNYPEGAYGVMSWWDYGHWITVMGHRIPYANPFQQGPVPASAYFQAANATRANLILEALPSLSENPKRVADMSVAELRDIVADQPQRVAGENGRYVIIDHAMAGEKFRAITKWAGPQTGAYFQPARYRFQGRNVTLTETSDRYRTSMLATMYYRDARTLSHYRLVHEVDRYAIVGGYIQDRGVRPLTSLPLRRGWSEVAGLAAQLQRADRQRQVVSIGRNRFVYNAAVESSVKIYEHVEGVTLRGTVPNAENGTSVFAVLRLQTHTGRNFTYVQRTTTKPDGSFRMTVPHATSNIVVPSEGGTNSSVQALGIYRIRVGNRNEPTATGTVAVPETAIYDGETIEVNI